MSYRKCDERLGRMLDRFNPDTPVFLYFKGGTAYFDRGVSKAGELCDNPYLRGCTAFGSVIPRLPVGVDGSWVWIRRSTLVSTGV